MSSLVNRTYPGSVVVAHKDDSLPAKYGPYINFVFFIDGAVGENSGELMLSRDNEYRDIIFRPPSIKNTCLIYDAAAPFYHGFKPVKWGQSRIAATVSFFGSGYESPKRGEV
jgi:hypothetical protein